MRIPVLVTIGRSHASTGEVLQDSEIYGERIRFPPIADMRSLVHAASYHEAPRQVSKGGGALVWKSGRGLLGPLKPLVGEWTTEGGEGQTPAAGMRCTRSFRLLGKGWIELEARWTVASLGPSKEYRERAYFGAGDDGTLACFSFTSDGKRSVGRVADGSDVAADAIAFEHQMPAGLARMLYWPREGGAPGFRFAVESKTKKGWNRFLEQRFRPLC